LEIKINFEILENPKKKKKINFSFIKRRTKRNALSFFFFLNLKTFVLTNGLYKNKNDLNLTYFYKNKLEESGVKISNKTVLEVLSLLFY
jgi:hypothetical protein